MRRWLTKLVGDLLVGLRMYMESVLGHTLSKARVHKNVGADRLSDFASMDSESQKKSTTFQSETQRIGFSSRNVENSISMSRDAGLTSLQHNTSHRRYSQNGPDTCTP